MSNSQAETEINPEGIVALLVVFLLVVVFVAQSGLLSGTESNTELRKPSTAEIQSRAQAS